MHGHPNNGKNMASHAMEQKENHWLVVSIE